MLFKFEKTLFISEPLRLYYTEAVMFNHELRIDADISRDTRLKLTLEVGR